MSNSCTGRAHIWHFGAGEPILIVHGGPGLDHRYLTNFFQFTLSHGSLVLYDQLGCGLDETPIHKITARALVDQLEEVAGAVAGLGGLTVIAHSWGAYLAYELLARRAISLKRLVLVSPVGLTRSRFDASGERLADRIPEEVLSDLKDRTSVEGDDADVMNLIAPYYCANNLRPRNLSFPFFSSPVFDRVVETVGQYDYRNLGDTLLPACLKIYGDHDIEVAGDTIEIASSELVMIRGSGHFSFAEQPGEFQLAVTGFLQAA